MEEVDLSKINPDVHYTLKALADIVNYTSATLAKYVRSGELKAKKQGRKYYVRGQDFIKWWEKE